MKMKNRIYLFTLVLVLLQLSCQSEKPISETDKIFIARKERILSDDALKVKPVFIPLSPFNVNPYGWIKEWANYATY